jgi:Cupin domain
MRTHRYVTALDRRGWSCLDPDLSTIDLGKGNGVSEIWNLDRLPADNDDPADLSRREYEHDPSPGGVKFRMVELPPGTASGEAPDLQLVSSPTLDCVFVLQGVVTLLLEAEEVTMRPGDCAILRGHPHRWVNRSASAVLLAGGLVDARPMTG